MSDRLLYLLGVVAVGWAVTFGLRALPFVLFAGRDRELPKGVERFGAVISPVIIAGLIIYSYSGLEWRTAWPYLAGLLTVGLQLWKRNALVSILAGTIVYMCLLSCGCTSSRTIVLDDQNTMIHLTRRGVEFDNQPLAPEEIVEILVDADIPKTRMVFIRVDDDLTDLRPARQLMALLAKAGYRRPMLATSRHAESMATGKKPASNSPAANSGKTPKKIRYKKANE